MNVDGNPETALRYRVTYIPAIRTFHRDELDDTVIGARPKPQLEQVLAPHLG